MDRVAILRRGGPSQILASCRELRSARYDFAVDFQGLMKSALLAPWPGLKRSSASTGLKCGNAPRPYFYSTQTPTASAHKVEQNLDLAAAAGAVSLLRTFPSPRAPKKVTCRTATSCLPVLWLAGAANNGRWSSSVPSPGGCGPNRYSLGSQWPSRGHVGLHQVAHAIPVNCRIAGLIYATRRARP